MTDRTVLRILATAWLGLLCATLVLSLLAAANDTLPGDKRVMDWIQDRPLPGRNLSDAVRAITGTEVALSTGAAVSLILWLRGHRRQAVLLAVGLPVLLVLQATVKELVDRPRPDPDIVDVRGGYSSASFPSGHVMSGSFLYGFLLYLSLTLPLARGGGIALGAAAAVLIAVGGPVNVWLGVHWPSDVLGGWLWSSLILLPLVAADNLGAPDI